MSKINPFGREAAKRSAVDILQQNFGIGISDYDRGADVWDSKKVDDQGKAAPGWVHVPKTSRECVIRFTCNEGKGTGAQEIPADEFAQYVDSLEAIIASDYAEPEGPDRTEYVPTYQVASQSFKMARPRIVGADGSTTEDPTADRTVVSVRCVSGKGAKPMLVNRDEFPEVVGLLRQIAGNLSAFEAQAWERFETEQTAKAAQEAAQAAKTEGKGKKKE